MSKIRKILHAAGIAPSLYGAGIALTPHVAEIVLTLHIGGIARNQFGRLAKDRRKIF